MSLTQRKQTSVRFIDAASVCQPAVRMVVVEVWGGTDDDTGQPFEEVQLHPVVGLSMKAFREFVRLGDHEKPATPALADRDGWMRTHDGVDYSPLIVDDYYGLGDLGTLPRLTGSNYVAVACTWSATEDDERLAEYIERAKQFVRSTPPAGPPSDVPPAVRPAGRPTAADAGEGQRRPATEGGSGDAGG